jgi:hypothetical protein
MRTKVTLVLLLLNAVLFFFIFHFERAWRTERAYEEARRRILGPEVATINTLVISGGRLTAPVRLEKRADGWYLAKPLDWPANPNAVQRILNELQFLEHETSFAVADLARNGQSLADYGLDKPQLVLTFTSPGSTPVPPGATPATITLRIGDATKIGNRLYLLSPDGTRIHVVNRSLVESLDLDLGQLRSDTIFTIPVFEVRSLNLQTPAPTSLKIRLRRDGARWGFETPILARANKNAVELAINGLNTLRTGRFETRPLDDEQTGLASTALRVTLEGNGRRETLLLGKAVAANGGTPDAKGAPSDADLTDYYARMEDKPVLFTVAVPAPLLDSLRRAQETLRETRLFDFDPRTVTSVVLSAPHLPELTLQRLETGSAPLETDPWQVVTPSTGQGPRTQPAERERVQRLLQKLCLLQAQKFQSDAPAAADLEDWGFNRPDREITLILAPAAAATAAATGEPAPLRVLIGSPAGRDGVYAKLAGAPFVYVVAADILDETPVVPRLFRNHLLRELPAGARITGLKLTETVGGRLLFEKNLGDAAAPPSWENALAGESADRKAAVLSLLEQLRELRARRFVADQFAPAVEVAGEMRPWKYTLAATLAFTSGTGAQTATSTLFLSERTGGMTQLAGSPEFNVIFEADQPLIDACFTLTFGGKDPGFAPPPAAAVPVPPDAAPSPRLP